MDNITVHSDIITPRAYLKSGDIATEWPRSTENIYQATFEVDCDLIFRPNIAIIYGTLFALVVVPAVIVNALVILTYIRYFKLRTSISTYIVNLAVCDLCLVIFESVPMILQYIFPTEWSKYIISNVFCTFSFLFNTFFGTAAIMTLLAVSVERFCFVIHPVTTMAFATRTETRAKFIVVLVWCVAILPHLGNCVLFDSVKREKHFSQEGEVVYDVTFCVSAKADDSVFYGSFYTATVFLLLHVSTFITTMAIYYKIIRKLKKRNLRCENGNRISRPNHDFQRTGAHHHALRYTIKLLSFSVPMYLLGYSFYFYVNLYYVYFGLYRRQGFTMILIANWFGAFNACVNPVLHAVLAPKFRRALKSFLHCRKLDIKRTRVDTIYRPTQNSAVNPTEPDQTIFHEDADSNMHVKEIASTYL